MSEDNKVEERGIAAVGNTAPGAQAKGRVVIIVVAVLGIVGLTALTWKSEKKKEDKPEIAVKTGAVRGLDVAQVRQTEAPPAETKPAEPEERKVEVEDKMSEAARRAPVIAFRGTTKAAAQASDAAADPGVRQPGKMFEDNPLRSKLQATPITGVTASAITNMHMVVPQGTHIPCVLESAISSDQPGFVTCIVQRDVLSASGQVVLMEKGTQVTGEYQNGIERGQGRIFVLWSRARTSTGVIVNLASPATDAVGRAGFDGKIDHKFWERFGGALLLSIVKDGGAYLAGLSQQSGQTIQLNSTQASANNAAAIAVENSINIKPTLYKNQGELVSIFVARDLDFSSVYDLRRTETRTQIYDRTVSGDLSRTPPPPRK
ncbi:type IV secretion system protein VirB10 [Bradyrhizobium brasilense]|uniref:Type IV secretion system protein VirB10 n=1 Tax=Bradyrhizobium brasilense TaxID=1419277 RepID=A0A1G7NKC8_9BRAD|nr:type IV secretion system protein VirB10 [Bradyrhizobium brasilense]MCC8976136.1 type IV secretion system protein VirB10 [Bradyrhizobium brasilense]SDF74575.1 type IV secretion system protein VirB10 [Bradyrhizobium brasilense]